MRLKVGLLGIGKIARDQHIPSLNANPRFELAACASRNTTVAGLPSFPDLESMLAAVPDLHCISICTPPQAHYDAVMTALRAGKHVMLEKPPTATTRQIALLAEEAARRGLTLYQTWHSRCAGGVDAARDFLRARKLLSGKIVWKEDVHQWHPGQRWIWEPGGFGVFDPGVNALSLLTEILPQEVFVESALLEFPENQQAPIAANLRLRTADGIEIGAEFDFRQKGEQSWNIDLATTTGSLRLAHGGADLSIDGRAVTADASMAGEYPRLYQRFAALCDARKSDVDWRPFQLVADAFLVGERRIVAPHEI
jgi:predicted dehydrogenase